MMFTFSSVFTAYNIVVTSIMQLRIFFFGDRMINLQKVFRHEWYSVKKMGSMFFPY